jgi:hypothetical protein
MWLKPTPAPREASAPGFRQRKGWRHSFEQSVTRGSILRTGILTGTNRYTNLETSMNTGTSLAIMVPHTDATHSGEPLSAPHEAFVREFMANGGVASRAYAVAYPDVTSDASRRAHGSRLRATPAVAERIRALRQIAAQALNVEVAELALQAHEIASASMVDISPVEVFGCRHCHGIDGKYQWRDPVEACKAIDDWVRSANSPMPKPAPASTEGGYGYSSRSPVNPECEACRGLGVPMLRIIPSCDWPEGAKQAYEGVQVDGDGRVTKVLIADRSKWAHQRNQLAGSYAPTKVEGKHAHLHIHKQAPDTRTPMTLDEALAVMGVDESTIVSDQ